MNEQNVKKLTEMISAFCRDNEIKTEEVSKFLDSCKFQVLEQMVPDKSSYYVLKKDGRVQEFSDKKLQNSIADASDEIKEPLDLSDLNNIIKDIRSKVKGTGYRVVPSWMIKSFTLESLDELGFKDICESYGGYVD